MVLNGDQGLGNGFQVFPAFAADTAQASVNEGCILPIRDSVSKNSHRNNNIIIAKISQSPY